jgi:hypothetical protein
MDVYYSILVTWTYTASFLLRIILPALGMSQSRLPVGRARLRKGNFSILREQHPKAIGIGSNSKKGSSQHLGTVWNWACFLDGKNARPEPVPLEIRNDRPSESLVLAILSMHMYGVYRYVHFQHVHEPLYPCCEHRWGQWRMCRPKLHSLESRVCLERIADCVPSFVAYPKGMPVDTHRYSN